MASVPFSLHVQDAGDSIVIRIVGEVDLAASEEVVSAIQTAAASDVARIVMDMREVDFLDSSGLRALLEGHRSAADAGRSFQVAPGEAVARLLRLTRLEHLLDLVPEPPRSP